MAFTTARWRHLALNGNDLVWNGDHLAIEPCFEAYTPEGGDISISGRYVVITPKPSEITVSGSTKSRSGHSYEYPWGRYDWTIEFAGIVNVNSAVFSRVKNISEKREYYLFEVEFEYEEIYTIVWKYNGSKEVYRPKMNAKVRYESDIAEEDFNWKIQKQPLAYSNFAVNKFPVRTYVQDDPGESGGVKELYRAVDDDDNY